MIGVSLTAHTRILMIYCMPITSSAPSQTSILFYFILFPISKFSAFLCCHLLFLVLILIHIYIFCATHHRLSGWCFNMCCCRCNILSLVMEMDRILRPGGWVIFCDEEELLIKVEDIVKSMHWDIMFTYKIDNNSEQLLAVQKSFWRPDPSNL
jgi:hypothetical protein